jgi:ABC-type multidrug transport system ATPase subunit
MWHVYVILSVQTVLYAVLYVYLEQVIDTGIGVPRHPLFFLGIKWTLRTEAARTRTADVEGPDELPPSNTEVLAEERRVATLDKTQCAILVRALRKVYPGRGGQAPKVACRSLSLGVDYGECFGMLGPNGAGKTSTINMLVGFLPPTAGAAYIAGKDIATQSADVHAEMGLCPQHDLLWESLSAREHLAFYARLKGLHGESLAQAVDTALRQVNLFDVGDKRSGEFSGGMKRRLSVAISLVGDPKVVYMDEPSTGLDPSARQNLWRVIKAARAGRAIVLTTHSMEEAEELCNRLGIFVDGEMKVLGEPRELIRRYGRYLILTMTVMVVERKQAVLEFISRHTPAARVTRDIECTVRAEVPTDSVCLDVLFSQVLANKEALQLTDWSIFSASLEDVFVQVAGSAEHFD